MVISVSNFLLRPMSVSWDSEWFNDSSKTEEGEEAGLRRARLSIDISVSWLQSQSKSQPILVLSQDREQLVPGSSYSLTGIHPEGLTFSVLSSLFEDGVDLFGNPG